MGSSPSISFTKMQGAGNDFVIIDNRAASFTNKQLIEMTPALCDRHFGVGADGLMALQPPNSDSLDYTMLYRNADGSDAGMCGNGARCLARLAHKLGLGSTLTFNVHDQTYTARVDDTSAAVTIEFPTQIAVKSITEKTLGTLYQCHAGTEHLTAIVAPNLFQDDEKLHRLGTKYRHHPRFNPPGTNVNFIMGDATSAIKIKTYERGVEGLTLACGTGAIAAAVAWHHQAPKKPAAPITVTAEGGTLRVNFEYTDQQHPPYRNLSLTGDATVVFEGTAQL